MKTTPNKRTRTPLWLLAVISLFTLHFSLFSSAHAASKSVTAGQNITETGTAYNDTTGHALTVTGGTYTGTNITLTTSSNTRYGVNESNQARVNLTNSNISTSGTNSHGVNLSGTSVFTMTGGTITTGTTGANGVFAQTVSQVNMQDTVINSYAIGVALSGTSTGTLNNVNITTLGTNAHGVSLGISSTATLLNTNITTTGTNAHGVNVSGSSAVTMTGGTISTGTTGANGVSVGASQAVLKNVEINSYNYGVYLNTAATGTLDNVNITTKGADANGLQVQSSSTATLLNTNITTAGTNAHGVNAHGVNVTGTSVLTMTGGSIGTSGTSSYGIYITGSSFFSGSNLNVSTVGDAAHAIYVASGSAVISGGTLKTQGSGIGASSNGSRGVYVAASGYLSSSNLWISTSGSGQANGLTVNGGKAVVTDSYLETFGDSSRGIVIENSGSLHLVNADIRTTGSSGIGIMATSSGMLTVESGTISTAGSGAYGMYAQANAVIYASDMNIVTTGSANAAGFQVGSNALMVVNNGTAATSGNSHGIAVFASGTGIMTNMKVTTTGSGGAGLSLAVGYLEATNIKVDTSGANGHGARSVGGGLGEMYLTNATIKTTGVDAAGLYFLSGSDAVRILELNGGSVISQQSDGIAVNKPGNIESANNLATYNGVFDISIKGGASITGAENVLNVFSVMTGTDASGTEVAVDTPTVVTVNVDENSTLNGNVQLQDSATVTLSLKGNSTLTGASSRNDDSVLNINLDNSSQWLVTGNSNLTNLTNNGVVDFRYDAGTFKTLTVNNSDGTGVFKMNAMIGSDITPNHAGDLNGAGDLLVISGTASGDHQIIIKRQGGNALSNGEALQLMLVNSTVTTGTFHGSADVGMRSAQVQRGDMNGANSENWYLVLSATTINTGSTGGGGNNGGGKVDPPTPEIGEGGHVVLCTAESRYIAWFDQDTLVKRMGELRLNEGIFGDLNKTHDWEAWVRSYGSQYNMSGENMGHGNWQIMTYGVDIGADKAWNIDRRNVLYTGVFGGYGRADLDVKSGMNSSGGNDGYSAGVYGTWLHDTGWYADLVGKATYFDNSFKAHDMSDNSTNGDYGTWAAGVSLEFGRQFQFKDGWYAEPQAQASYAHFFGANYQTTGDNNFAVSVGDTDVLQLRFGSLFGRTIKLSEDAKDKGFLQPYVKLFGVEQISDGGNVNADGGQWRPDTDGMSAIIGCGLIYQIDETNQLHLDYEAQFASQYDKPFGINFGYRHQF